MFLIRMTWLKWGMVINQSKIVSLTSEKRLIRLLKQRKRILGSKGLNIETSESFNSCTNFYYTPYVFWVLKLILPCKRIFVWFPCIFSWRRFILEWPASLSLASTWSKSPKIVILKKVNSLGLTTMIDISQFHRFALSVSPQLKISWLSQISHC